MNAPRAFSSAPLRLRVKEPSPGLFSWMVMQLPPTENGAEVCIDASDHPYPTHDAATSIGMACLKAHRAAVCGSYLYEPNVVLPAAGVSLRSGA